MTPFSCTNPKILCVV